MDLAKRKEAEFIRRINRAKELKIIIPEELNPQSRIRGVYCFVAVKQDQKIPFYIGKSNNIFLRMFQGGSSHLNDYLRGVRRTEVHRQIEKYIENGYHIEIRILKKVEYTGDTFAQDANRLALVELKELVEYQDKGFCLEQLSEAVKGKYEREEWEGKFLNL